jgi:hypothetical protein
VKRGGSLSFLVGAISNVLVMEIGWTDVGSGGYTSFIYSRSTHEKMGLCSGFLLPIILYRDSIIIIKNKL